MANEDPMKKRPDPYIDLTGGICRYGVMFDPAKPSLTKEQLSRLRKAIPNPKRLAEELKKVRPK